MTQVEDFIYQFEGSQRDVLFYFHNLLIEELNLVDKIRFKIPFYYRKSWICYLNPLKGDKIELAFTRGNELSNSQGLLVSKERKQIRGIEFENLAGIPFQALK